MQYLAGRYRLVERLGAGGMSVVWRAYDEVLVRPVAVKVLSPSSAADPWSRERIRDEARAAARLCHPYITNVYDYGESTADGGPTVPFVVMELVDGEPLDRRLARGPVPWQFAVEVCAQVAAALSAVHARGLVHRDIKPANVMLTSSGAKLVDFGISAVAGDRTDSGQVYGTPAYIAPERLDGGPVQAASDVYALGLVLYRALAGQLPWDASTTTEMLTAHCHVPPQPLPRVPGLPASVADLCRRCLAKDPAARPDADEVARVLFAAAPAADGRFAGPRQRSAAAARNARRRFLARAGVLSSGAVAAAFVLVTCAGTDTTPPRADAAPQAAAPGSEANPERGCQVVYATRTDAGGRFEVEVTVTNTGVVARPEWTLAFDYPAGQRVVGLTGAGYSQQDARVTVRGQGPLATGASAVLAVTGTYAASNPMPTAFDLDGQRCAGSVVPAAADQAAGGPAPANPAAGNPAGNSPANAAGNAAGNPAGDQAAARGGNGNSGNQADNGKGAAGKGKGEDKPKKPKNPKSDDDGGDGDG